MIPCAIERCRVNIRVDIQYFHRTVNGIWRTREACSRQVTKKGRVSDIVSDCQGSLKTLQRARKGRRPKGAQGHVTAAYSYPTVRERTEARWARSHPELDQSKNGRWTPDDWGMWLSDGVAGREMVEGIYRSKTITSLQVVDGDSLIKDFFSRGGNYVHITTTTDCGVLLQPIKDMVARRSFDKYCIRRDGYRAKALKPQMGGLHRHFCR